MMIFLILFEIRDTTQRIVLDHVRKIFVGMSSAQIFDKTSEEESDAIMSFGGMLSKR